MTIDYTGKVEDRKVNCNDRRSVFDRHLMSYGSGVRQCWFESSAPWYRWRDA